MKRILVVMFFCIIFALAGQAVAKTSFISIGTGGTGGIYIPMAAAYTTPENAVKYSPIPLHPGTVKYLKEKGVAIPAMLMP